MALTTFNPEGIVLDANYNFVNATGYKQDEVIGKQHRLFCAETLYKSNEYRQFWERLNQGEFLSGQFPRIHRQGDPLWFRATYNPVLHTDRQLVIIVNF
ncbi:PAS domain-containing protein, partial [Leclercia adecarboxylata]|uniref:PAS domain-containing protein n=1 Tax=Leclercia adecarboxylata TaxID=83655 RepID=UPI00234D5D29